MLDWRPKGCGFQPHGHHCGVSFSKNINPSLVLVQPRNTCPFITERLLMGRKKSNQTTQRCASMLDNLPSWVCKQQKRRPACASTHSKQHLCYSLFFGEHQTNLATDEISFFKFVFVAEETGLRLVLSETWKTGFVGTRPKCKCL